MNVSTNNGGQGTPRLAPSPALVTDSRHGDRHGSVFFLFFLDSILFFKKAWKTTVGFFRHFTDESCFYDSDRPGERSSSSHHHSSSQQQQQQQPHSNQNYASTNGGNIHPALLAAVQQNRSNAGSPANFSRQ